MIVASADELRVSRNVICTKTITIVVWNIIPKVIITDGRVAIIIIFAYPIACVTCNNIIVNGWGRKIIAEDAPIIP